TKRRRPLPNPSSIPQPLSHPPTRSPAPPPASDPHPPPHPHSAPVSVTPPPHHTHPSAMVAAVARLLARRGCGTGIVARRTIGGSNPAAGVTRSIGGAATGTEAAATGTKGAPAPPTSNLIWLANAVHEFDHKASLEFHALDAETRALARIFAASKDSYNDAVCEGKWSALVATTMVSVFGVATSFAMTAYGLARDAEHHAEAA
ncbi:unnamed protein product, partial [Urochloa humidicola]